jgi:hypothetical protein
MVVDERGVFKDDCFQAAVAALQDGNAAAATTQNVKGANKGDKKQPKQVIMSAQFFGGGVPLFSTADMLCTLGCGLQLIELAMMQGFERHSFKQQHTKGTSHRVPLQNTALGP